MIYYSHVNEDSTPEQVAMSKRSYDRLVCIAGSGERVIALMDKSNLSRVMVIDSNSEALFLTELKLKAIKYLEIGEYLEFIGLNKVKSYHPRSITAMFTFLTPYLTEGCASYWKQRLKIIKNGSLLTIGHFETFLKKTTSILKGLIGSRTDDMLKNPFYLWPKFDQILWSFLMQSFGNKLSYKLLGMRDPAFIESAADISLIPNAMQEIIEKNALNKSFFAHMIFRGNLDEMQERDLPISFNKQFLKKVKENLCRNELKVEFICDDLLSYCARNEETVTKSTFYSLSDLLSFVSIEYLEKLVTITLCNQNTTNALIFRSFLKHRKNNYSDLLRSGLTLEDCSHLDATNMYQVLHLASTTYAN